MADAPTRELRLRGPRDPDPPGRHDRLRALPRRRRHGLALVQVPPPPRLPVHERRLPELPRAGRRRDRRALLHAPGRRRHEGRAAERHGLARARPAGDERHAPDAQVPAGRLLLQDADQAALALAQGRADDPQGRRPRQASTRATCPATSSASTGTPTSSCSAPGPAGLAAALGAAEAGATVIVADEGEHPGSRLGAGATLDAVNELLSAGRGQCDIELLRDPPRVRSLRGPRGAADRTRPARDDAAEGDRRRHGRVRVDGGLPRQRRARRHARPRRGAPRDAARDQARQGRRRARRDARGRRAHRGPAGRRHGGRRGRPARRRR